MSDREPTIVSMTDEDLRKFVIDYCDGRVFTSADIRNPEQLSWVFLPLMDINNLLTKSEIESVGLIYEEMSKALPRGINGMPMFTSCRFMNIDDHKRACAAIDRELKRRRNIEV